MGRAVGIVFSLLRKGGDVIIPEGGDVFGNPGPQPLLGELLGLVLCLMDRIPQTQKFSDFL